MASMETTASRVSRTAEIEDSIVKSSHPTIQPATDPDGRRTSDRAVDHGRELRSQFNEHGLRCTPQRLAILSVLRATSAHPTAEELHQLAAAATGTTMSLATVYNTLDVLCRHGLAQRLPTSSGSFRYDGTTHRHVHVSLPEAQHLVDVPEELGQALLEGIRPEVLAAIEDRLGVRIEGVSIQLEAERAEDAATSAE